MIKYIAGKYNGKSIFTLLLFMFLWCCSCKINTNTYNQLPYNAFLARFEVKMTNSIITESNLLMTPMYSKINLKKYKKFYIYGSTENRVKNKSSIDAKHDAISKLLTKHGKKLIKSKRILINTNQTDIVSVIYEGIVKDPVKIKKNELINKKLYILFEIWFCINYKPL